MICFAADPVQPDRPAAAGRASSASSRSSPRWSTAISSVEAPAQPGFYLLLLLVVGGLNTAISLFYYLRVVKVMTIDAEPRDRPPFAYSDVSLGRALTCG